MKAPGDARKRILLLFSLGIAAPSLLLGYLAFRGIQNDLALVEQERREEHRLISGRIDESLSESIADVERSFDEAVAGLGDVDQFVALEALDGLRLGKPAIQGVFLLSGNGSVRLVSPQPVFAAGAGGISTAAATNLPSVPGELEAGRALELRETNLSGALEAYREVFAEAADRHIRGEALAAIGRVQRKSGSFVDAATSYRALVRDFGSLRMIRGMPFAVVGRLELASSLVAAGDTIGAAQSWVELHRGLLRAEWSLTPSEFDFFTGRIQESVQSTLLGASGSAGLAAYRDTLVSLAEGEVVARSVTAEHLAFEERASATLAERLGSTGAPADGPWRRLTLDAGNRTYPVSVQGALDRSAPDFSGSWGILLDQDALIGDLLRSAIETQVPDGAATWIARGRTGERLLGSVAAPEGPATVTTGLASDFLSWTLELYRPESPLVETFMTSRRGVYFYSFLLLTGILAFGLTLTARSVTHQLQLARMKSDFVSTVSHEFKSPLTAIRQLAEMLQSERVPSEEQRRRYYDVLVEQSERLTALVDSVLDLARMDEGRYELDQAPTDVGSLLEQIVERVEHRVGHEGFTIRSEIEAPAPVVTIDAAALTQATTNLIDNAVKYSGDSKEVIVRGASRNGHFEIAVEDFGIGLEDDETAKVFDRFYRGGDALTRAVKGTGLGLTLVKQIAEAHGGSVAIETKIGSGSTFSIHLPLDVESEAEDG